MGVDSKDLIKNYYQSEDKKLYDEILSEYKIRYIYSESKVEGNITPEEQLGISEVYNYIERFDFFKDYFNIFTTSLIIHQKLYSKCVGSDFGGNLRDTQAILKDTNIEVMSAEEAKIYFNTFIKNSDEIFEPLAENDILTYIEKCVYTTTELIKAQPFADGNKRTFRSLLNLMLKRITLPPVYISLSKRKDYKDALLKAMGGGQYTDLYNFYYKRIEESIIELDLENREYNYTKYKTKKLINDIHRF